MKGILLAGGTGSRLYPSTRVTSKHLLAVFNQPMIFYPLQTLIKAGVEDILIVTGKEHAGDMIELLGSGSEFGVNFTYRVQDKASGIAKALYLAKDFAGDPHFITILGDNLLENEIEIGSLEQAEAKIFLKEVADPQRFGVAEVQKNNIKKITEKPPRPKSNLAVIGVYIYDYSVFSIIERLKPSPPPRSEYEITAVNNAYIKHNKLKYSIIKGFWSDMGTPDSLLKSANFVKSNQDKFLIRIQGSSDARSNKGT